MTYQEQLMAWRAAHPNRLAWVSGPSLNHKLASAHARTETGIQRIASGATGERACELLLGMLKALGCA